MADQTPSSSSAAAAKQHRGINAAIKPLESHLVPQPGPVTVYPGAYSIDYFVKPIQAAIPEAEITDLSQDTVGLIWLDNGSPDAAEKLSEILKTHAKIRWVQFPMAGIEKFDDVIRANPHIVWTSAKVSKAVIRRRELRDMLR